MNRAPLVAVVAMLVGACGRKEPAKASSVMDAAPAPSPLATATASSAPPQAIAPAASASPYWVPTDTVFETEPPVRATSIGHTSVVMKVTLEGGAVAAFKPKSKRGPVRYKGEVAAYRLAKALGLLNVPPAYAVAYPTEKVRAAFAAGGAAKTFDDEVVSQGGYVFGAILPWIDGLTFVPLETDAWRSKWTTWLKHDGMIPEEQRTLAADISTMIVFDYVTANFDRWSGGNVGKDPKTGRLLFIDNDGAFYEQPHEGPLAHQLALLKATDRFSKSFVKALEGLRRDDLHGILGNDAAGAPLYAEELLDAIDARRVKALAAIRGKTLDLD